MAAETVLGLTVDDVLGFVALVAVFLTGVADFTAPFVFGAPTGRAGAVVGFTGAFVTFLVGVVFAAGAFFLTGAAVLLVVVKVLEADWTGLGAE